MESSYQWPNIRERKQKILLEIDTKAWPIYVRGSLWIGGRRIAISPRALSMGGNILRYHYENLVLIAHTFDVFGEGDDRPENMGISVGRSPGYKNASDCWCEQRSN